MSLLMFLHEQDNVLIVTDTLATSEGEPFMFQSKVFLFPHANMVMAVTGVALVGERWAEALRSSCLYRDVADVDTFATEALRRIEREVLGDKLGELSMTTTLYHFGFEQDGTSPVRYTYRSKKGFESESEEGPGVGVKPEPDDLTALDTLDDIIAMAEAIREKWAKHPEPIYIGGELYATSLNNWHQSTVRIHRFADYDQQWAAMLALMRANTPPEDETVAV